MRRHLEFDELQPSGSEYSLWKNQAMNIEKKIKRRFAANLNDQSVTSDLRPGDKGTETQKEEVIALRAKSSASKFKRKVMRHPWSLALLALLIVASPVGAQMSSQSASQSLFQVENVNRLPDGSFLPPVLDPQGMPLADTNFLAELWGSATPDSLAPLLSFNTEPRRRVFARFIRPGHFFSAEIAALGSVPPGRRAWLQVRVWDSRLGAAYEQVAARGIGGFGESPLFNGQGQKDCDPPCVVPGNLAGLQSFNVRAATGVLLQGIRRQGSDVVIDWWPGFKQYQLQQTHDINQPWQNLGSPTSATSSTNAMTHPAQHFRVIGLTQVMLAAR